MGKLHCVILGVAAAVISVGCALSEEDKNAIKAEMIPILIDCGKEYGITIEDVIAAKDAMKIDAFPPCYFACFLKKRNIINEDGNFAPDVAKSEHAKFIHDKEIVSKLDSVSDTCTSVNDKTVTDGNKGCDRSQLLFSCMTEHKDLFITVFKE